MNLAPGSVIGSYRIDREIGRGGRAVVYQAWQHTVGRWVVLKVLTQRDPGALEEFRHEVQFTANLRHPAVRQVYDAGQTPEGYAYLAMQHVEASLRQVMRGADGQPRRFGAGEVARLLRPVAEVLDTLHSGGMVHLDVKPENILVAHDGLVVLADFGSARPAGTHTHEGTPAFFSPEQAAGDRPVSGRSDLYSLACVACELLSGRPPFVGENAIVLARQHLEQPAPALHRLGVAAPRRLERLLRRALSKDPGERPATAQAFVHELSAQAGAAPRRAVAQPGQGAARRRAPLHIASWGLWALAAVVLLVLLLSVAAVVLALANAPLPQIAACAVGMAT